MRHAVWLGSMAVLLAACGAKDDALLQGYVEGEFVYLAAPQAGYLDTLKAPRGTRVAAGDLLFALDPAPDRQGLDAAEARVGSSRERVANLEAPRRQAEIAVLDAQLAQAEAALALSESQLKKQESLAEARFVSPLQLDSARAARDRDQARVEELKRQRVFYRDAIGRSPEVAGAVADLKASAAQADQQRWLLVHKAVAAPAVGEVADTYYRPGEWVAAGAPVLSFLPDDARKVRFYVPEGRVATLRPGQAVAVSCDGCAAGLKARIAFIAPQAEYTPPVIYSRETRAKLVFRVEAVVPPETARQLRPGLPVDVRPEQ